MSEVMYLCKVINLTIKKADSGDIDIIYLLADKIWRAHYPSIITMEQIEYMLQMMYSKEALKKQMDEGQHFLLAFKGELPVGYISYSVKDTGDYFLHKFYVDTEKHRNGIGSVFFNQVFSGFEDLKTIRLTVNRKNYKAINFYFKQGFIIEEVKDFDIGNNYEMNDFIMLYKRN
jgi:ribosomal protein S18 acetylase RimI-like enzyme